MNLKDENFDVLTLEQLNEIKGGLFGIRRCKVVLTNPCTQVSDGHWNQEIVYGQTAWGNFWGASCSGVISPC